MMVVMRDTALEEVFIEGADAAGDHGTEGISKWEPEGIAGGIEDCEKCSECDAGSILVGT